MYFQKIKLKYQSIQKIVKIELQNLIGQKYFQACSDVYVLNY